jgi:ankyrin repeat protein
LEVVHALLNTAVPVRVDVTDKQGMTPLIWAAFSLPDKIAKQIVALLLDTNADPHLLGSAYQENVHTITLL